jgi:hypothetical protein
MVAPLHIHDIKNSPAKIDRTVSKGSFSNVSGGSVSSPSIREKKIHRMRNERRIKINKISLFSGSTGIQEMPEEQILSVVSCVSNRKSGNLKKLRLGMGEETFIAKNVDNLIKESEKEQNKFGDYDKSNMSESYDSYSSSSSSRSGSDEEDKWENPRDNQPRTFSVSSLDNYTKGKIPNPPKSSFNLSTFFPATKEGIKEEFGSTTDSKYISKS